MSSKKQRRREMISAVVLEQGAVTVGSLAERFDVSIPQVIDENDYKVGLFDFRKTRHGKQR